MILQFFLLKGVIARLWAVILIGFSLGSAATAQSTSIPATQPVAPEKMTLLDEAFAAAQWVSTSSAAAALRIKADRGANTDPALTALLTDRQSLLDAIERKEKELANAGTRSSGDNLDRAAVLAGEIDGLLSDLDLIETQIGRDFPDYARATRPAQMSIAQVQSHLEPDEALIFVYTGRVSTHVFAIRPDDVVWHRVGLGRSSMQESVTAIRQSLIQANLVRSAAALDDDELAESPPGSRAAAYEEGHALILYLELFGPLEAFLTEVKHLYTVTDGPMSGLPLSLLLARPLAKPSALGEPDVLRQAQWFFQRHALTTLPSVDALALVTAPDTGLDTGPSTAPDGGTQAQIEPTLPFVGIGDPIFAGAINTPSDGQFFRSGQADLDSLRALAPLPATRREILTLARLLGAEENHVFLGSNAREPQITQAPLDRAKVIAFATHGLLSGELKGLAEPALVLTPPEDRSPEDDGLLTASEIARMSLRADWVILSACNTAGSDGTPDAEGLSGLARAFLMAGARTLMVSHWPVRDDAAARLTTGTITALTSPRRKAEALQSAMTQLMQDDSDPSLAHPAAWAPFVLVGHGGI
jgi:CHAT domain-containing protein